MLGPNEIVPAKFPKEDEHGRAAKKLYDSCCAENDLHKTIDSTQEPCVDSTTREQVKLKFMKYKRGENKAKSDECLMCEFRRDLEPTVTLRRGMVSRQRSRRRRKNAAMVAAKAKRDDAGCSSDGTHARTSFNGKPDCQSKHSRSIGRSDYLGSTPYGKAVTKLLEEFESLCENGTVMPGSALRESSSETCTDVSQSKGRGSSGKTLSSEKLGANAPGRGTTSLVDDRVKSMSAHLFGEPKSQSVTHRENSPCKKATTSKTASHKVTPGKGKKPGNSMLQKWRRSSGCQSMTKQRAHMKSSTVPPRISPVKALHSATVHHACVKTNITTVPATSRSRVPKSIAGSVKLPNGSKRLLAVKMNDEERHIATCEKNEFQAINSTASIAKRTTTSSSKSSRESTRGDRVAGALRVAHSDRPDAATTSHHAGNLFDRFLPANAANNTCSTSVSDSQNSVTNSTSVLPSETTGSSSVPIHHCNTENSSSLVSTTAGSCNVATTVTGTNAPGCLGAAPKERHLEASIECSAQTCGGDISNDNNVSDVGNRAASQTKTHDIPVIKLHVNTSTTSSSETIRPTSHVVGDRTAEIDSLKPKTSGQAGGRNVDRQSTNEGITTPETGDANDFVEQDVQRNSVNHEHTKTLAGKPTPCAEPVSSAEVAHVSFKHISDVTSAAYDPLSKSTEVTGDDELDKGDSTTTNCPDPCSVNDHNGNSTHDTSIAPCLIEVSAIENEDNASDTHDAHIELNVDRNDSFCGDPPILEKVQPIAQNIVDENDEACMLDKVGHDHGKASHQSLSLDPVVTISSDELSRAQKEELVEGAPTCKTLVNARKESVSETSAKTITLTISSISDVNDPNELPLLVRVPSSETVSGDNTFHDSPVTCPSDDATIGVKVNRTICNECPADKTLTEDACLETLPSDSIRGTTCVGVTDVALDTSVCKTGGIADTGTYEQYNVKPTTTENCGHIDPRMQDIGEFDDAAKCNVSQMQMKKQIQSAEKAGDQVSEIRTGTAFNATDETSKPVNAKREGKMGKTKTRSERNSPSRGGERQVKSDAKKKEVAKWRTLVNDDAKSLTIILSTKSSGSTVETNTRENTFKISACENAVDNVVKTDDHGAEESVVIDKVDNQGMSTSSKSETEMGKADVDFGKRRRADEHIEQVSEESESKCKTTYADTTEIPKGELSGETTANTTIKQVQSISLEKQENAKNVSAICTSSQIPETNVGVVVHQHQEGATLSDASDKETQIKFDKMGEEEPTLATIRQEMKRDHEVTKIEVNMDNSLKIDQKTCNDNCAEKNADEYDNERAGKTSTGECPDAGMTLNCDSNVTETVRMDSKVVSDTLNKGTLPSTQDIKRTRVERTVNKRGLRHNHVNEHKTMPPDIISEITDKSKAVHKKAEHRRKFLKRRQGRSTQIEMLMRSTDIVAKAHKQNRSESLASWSKYSGANFAEIEVNSELCETANQLPAALAKEASNNVASDCTSKVVPCDDESEREKCVSAREQCGIMATEQGTTSPTSADDSDDLQPLSTFSIGLKHRSHGKLGFAKSGSGVQRGRPKQRQRCQLYATHHDKRSRGTEEGVARNATEQTDNGGTERPPRNTMWGNEKDSGYELTADSTLGKQNPADKIYDFHTEEDEEGDLVIDQSGFEDHVDRTPLEKNNDVVAYGSPMTTEQAVDGTAAGSQKETLTLTDDLVVEKPDASRLGLLIKSLKNTITLPIDSSESAPESSSLSTSDVLPKKGTDNSSINDSARKRKGRRFATDGMLGSGEPRQDSPSASQARVEESSDTKIRKRKPTDKLKVFHTRSRALSESRSTGADSDCGSLDEAKSQATPHRTMSPVPRGRKRGKPSGQGRKSDMAVRGQSEGSDEVTANESTIPIISEGSTQESTAVTADSEPLIAKTSCEPIESAASPRSQIQPVPVKKIRIYRRKTTKLQTKPHILTGTRRKYKARGTTKKSSKRDAGECLTMACKQLKY